MSTSRLPCTSQKHGWRLKRCLKHSLNVDWPLSRQRRVDVESAMTRQSWADVLKKGKNSFVLMSTSRVPCTSQKQEKRLKCCLKHSLNVDWTMSHQCRVDVESTMTGQSWVDVSSQNWPNDESSLLSQSHVNIDSTLTQCWLDVESTCWLNVDSMLAQCWVNMLTQCWLNVDSMLSQHVDWMLPQCWLNVDSMLSQHVGSMLTQRWTFIGMKVLEVFTLS